MKLSELKPAWHDPEKKDFLVFECPAQHYPKGFDTTKCMIAIPIKPQENGWTWVSGENFEDATIRNSIWHHCEKDPHFFITNGEIEML